MTVTETMPPMIGRVRAYFGPVQRVTGEAAVPTMFDPAQNGTFALEAPPAPWVDLGWIEGFTRCNGTEVKPVRLGAPAVTGMQVRTEVEATVRFNFASWSKLQLSLTAGTQQMNLLTTVASTTGAGSGGAAPAATALTPGSTATTLNVGAAAAAGFAIGRLVAVDEDYTTGQTGFVGAGASGAYLRTVVGDVNYIRRVTLNTGRVAAVSGGTLTLEAPLLAGVPTAAMKVSSVVGFCDREGSSFFQEWSGLFVGEGQQGERVTWYYPRLQTMSGISEQITAAAGGYQRLRLTGTFRALPVNGPVDGESVVCFRSYVAG